VGNQRHQSFALKKKMKFHPGLDIVLDLFFVGSYNSFLATA